MCCQKQIVGYCCSETLWVPILEPNHARYHCWLFNFLFYNWMLYPSVQTLVPILWPCRIEAWQCPWFQGHPVLFWDMFRQQLITLKPFSHVCDLGPICHGQVIVGQPTNLQAYIWAHNLLYCNQNSINTSILYWLTPQVIAVSSNSLFYLMTLP
jgi:hypothetical protein